MTPSNVKSNNNRIIKRSYISHNTILIDSDDDLAVFPGSGTKSDPYIIGNFNITSLTAHEEFWFETWDDNPNYYEFYVDGVLYDTGNYSEQRSYYYNNNDLIHEVGLHNLSVIAYDQFDNYRKESVWIKAYSEGTDVRKPGIRWNVNSYYELGNTERYNFWLYEKNPDYYEIKLNDEIIASGNYNPDNFEIFFTGKKLFSETGI